MKAENLDKARAYFDRLTAIRVFANDVHGQAGGEVGIKIAVNGCSVSFSKIALRHVQAAIADEEKMIRNTLEMLGVEI